MQSNEVVADVEVQDELQIDQAPEETTEAITLQALDDFNTNVVTGVLGITFSLGILFGALLGGVYANITR